MTTSLLYVCLDGLGDDPIPAFDGRTPLEAADTPNLDALAARGRTGTVVTVGPGIAPESDPTTAIRQPDASIRTRPNCSFQLVVVREGNTSTSIAFM